MKICSRALFTSIMLGTAICASMLDAQTPSKTHQQVLYVVNESSQNISAYKIDSSTGALSEIVGSPFSALGFPVSIAVQPGGRFVFAANYLASTISAFAINQTSGALTPVTGSPFPAPLLPNSLVVHPSGRFLYVVSAGANQVAAYVIASSGTLTQISGSPFATGVDPRSITVEPLGRFAYVTNGNLTFSDSVTAYTINPASGALAEISGSPFPAGSIPAAATPMRRAASSTSRMPCPTTSRLT